jgi:hypothetical protein
LRLGSFLDGRDLASRVTRAELLAESELGAARRAGRRRTRRRGRNGARANCTPSSWSTACRACRRCASARRPSRDVDAGAVEQLRTFESECRARDLVVAGVLNARNVVDAACASASTIRRSRAR